MFDSLTKKLGNVFRDIRGLGKISEANIQEALKEVRTALLEADVNVQVAREIIDDIAKKAVGMPVLPGVTPDQQFIKVIYDELTELLGGGEGKLLRAEYGPTVIMLAGLQGSGKTTTAGKLARLYAKEGFQPYLVPVDLARPAAILQLKTLAASINVPVYDSEGQSDPVAVVRSAMKEMNHLGTNVMILDTAGRLHVDDALMAELDRVKQTASPTETLLVADAMTGQDSVTVAKTFADRIGIDGVILTKLDGDARGGAAISMKHVTGKTVRYIGVGEKTDQLELFHPARMASRIIGMGDVLTLIEKAQETVDKEEAERLQGKMLSGEFTLQDFLDQLRQVKKMGPLDSLMKLIPGMSGLGDAVTEAVDDRELKRLEAIINSMTRAERINHNVINGSRRKRIAAGSGTSIEDVNRLLKQFVKMKKVMKQMTGGKMKKLMGALGGGNPFQGLGMNLPGGGKGRRFF